MDKKIIITLSALCLFGYLPVNAAGVDKLEPINPPSGAKQQPAAPASSSNSLDTVTVYYPNANIKSAISKYKAGNYTGCLQELFSLVQKDPSNALAYYYMAMSYTHINMQNEAVNAYEKVISLNPGGSLVEYATRGKDCLTGGPACKSPEAVKEQEEQLTELDKFINAPYGNGLSPQLTEEVKQKQLINIQQTINTKEQLEKNDIQRIKKFDSKNKSSADTDEKIAQVSDEDVLNAIKTLKDAGLNLSVQTENPYNQMMQYQDPQMLQMSMLLGGNNNNSRNMMNMLPMLMSQAQKGENKNIDPRLMQAMMMNSMMSDFSFTNDNNKY